MMKRKCLGNLKTGFPSPKIVAIVAFLVTLSASASFMPALAMSSKPSFESKWLVENRLAWVRVSIDGRTADFHVTVSVAKTTTYVLGELRTEVRVNLEKIEPLSLSYAQLRIDFPDGSYIRLEWVNGPSSNPKQIRTIRFHIAPGIMQQIIELIVVLIGIAALVVPPPFNIILQPLVDVIREVVGAAKEDPNSDGSWDIWVPIDYQPGIWEEWILIATPRWWWKITTGSTGRKRLEGRNNPPPPTKPILIYTAHIETLSGRRHTRYNVVSWHVEKGSVPLTYTVTLYYVGGSSETFHWVVRYNFRQN